MPTDTATPYGLDKHLPDYAKPMYYLWIFVVLALAVIGGGLVVIFVPHFLQPAIQLNDPLSKIWATLLILVAMLFLYSCNLPAFYRSDIRGYSFFITPSENNRVEFRILSHLQPRHLYFRDVEIAIEFPIGGWFRKPKLYNSRGEIYHWKLHGSYRKPDKLRLSSRAGRSVVEVGLMEAFMVLKANKVTWESTIYHFVELPRQTNYMLEREIIRSEERLSALIELITAVDSSRSRVAKSKAMSQAKNQAIDAVIKTLDSDDARLTELQKMRSPIPMEVTA